MVVLVAALELAGVAQEEDAATYRAAYEEARDAGVDRQRLAEAEEMLQRLDQPSKVEADAAWLNGNFPSLVLGMPDGITVGDSDASAPVFPPLPPVCMAVTETEGKRRKAEMPGTEVKEEPEDGPDALRKWSLRMIEVALLQCRKKKAAEMEDFDLAHRLKQREPAATLRLTAARRACLACKDVPAGEAAEDRKRQRSPEEEEELQSVKRQKQDAVEEEDFARASELRRRELELERRLRGDDARAAAAALQLLSESSPEDLICNFDPGVAECASGTGPEVWEAVLADLRAAAH
ncbi:unnamed protein product [Effrenium voratum]|nr:unnamed protein product [Effrenium voratum]CAJ1421725.1 unnamed protein product [Effrenium voratum]